ncbi:oligosaccharide flippase family protein [Plasticicumulans acidivorans]|uniref:O-antigen/teichoic acid export membrane protein n=1 Tax=Plasticicumulans acidivorans TaxID=886464 RepID=A0A317MQP1_9GAMM|nr:oligosaccharide flippase family protein [Plasticicumulans acidivorans]PWV58442.1 O-antigen/teichoic acid export membrane protein [Plasticicumulans acidivorans]
MKLKFDEDLKEFLKKGSTALFIKAVSAALAFFLNVYLARSLGAGDAGIYFICLNTALFLSTFARCGLDTTIIKLVASYSYKNDKESIACVSIKSLTMVFIICVFFILVINLFSDQFLSLIFNESKKYVYAVCCSLIMMALSFVNISSSFLRGVRSITNSSLVLSFLTPAFALFFMFFSVPIFGVVGALWSYFFASLCAVGYGLFKYVYIVGVGRFRLRYLNKVAGYEILNPAKKAFFISVSQALLNSAPAVLAGMLTSPVDTAVFSVALRTALLTSFVYLSAETIMAPKLAALFASGNIEKANKFANRASLVLSFVSMPVFLIIVIFSKSIMGMFGKDFSDGSLLLIIISCGQFVNFATGFSSSYLFMIGAETIVRNVMVLSATVFFVCSLLMGYWYGVLGIAVSLAIVIAGQNIYLSIYAFKKYGVITAPLYIKNIGKKNNEK